MVACVLVGSAEVHEPLGMPEIGERTGCGGTPGHGELLEIPGESEPLWWGPKANCRESLEIPRETP